MNYSVLMSVYYKENPAHLRESIRSMLDQTAPPDDFVLVCDGPLNEWLDGVIAQFQEEYPRLFQVIRLEKNVGIGGAANEGLRYCRNELIAKMDADDIALPHRCARQLALFGQNPQLAIVGAQLAEFKGSTSNVVAVRRVPLMHKEICRYARRRMPFNNQTIMYKKSAVQATGGYLELQRCEDYSLVVRMLQTGAFSQNLDEVLVYFRLSEDAYRRRGMRENLASFIRVRWDIHRSGFSSLADFLIPCAGQVLLSAMPNGLRDRFYRSILRK